MKYKNGLKWLKTVSFYKRQAHCMYKTGCNRPGGSRAIYRRDDTWTDNIKKPLKAGCRFHVGNNLY